MKRRATQLMLGGVADGRRRAARTVCSPRAAAGLARCRPGHQAAEACAGRAGRHDAGAHAAAAQKDLLRGVDPADVRQPGPRLHERRPLAGEALFRQGDPADGLFVLSQGSISIVGRSGTVSQRFLSMSPGMMVGEAAMIDGQGRSADAVADMPTRGAPPRPGHADGDRTRAAGAGAAAAPKHRALPVRSLQRQRSVVDRAGLTMARPGSGEIRRPCGRRLRRSGGPRPCTGTNRPCRAATATLTRRTLLCAARSCRAGV